LQDYAAEAGDSIQKPGIQETNFMASWLQNDTRRRLRIRFRSQESKRRTLWLPGFEMRPRGSRGFDSEARNSGDELYGFLASESDHEGRPGNGFDWKRGLIKMRPK
jgi:hypothetical protein